MTSDYTGLFILLCFTAGLSYMAVSAFRTKRTVKSMINWKWRILIFLIVLLAAYFFPSTRAQGLDAFPAPGLLTGIVADIIAFTGLLVLLWARKTLGANWSPFIVIKEKHELIKTGPYRFVRHPMYGGFLLLFLGLAIWIGSVTAYGFFLFILIVFRLKGLKEEKLLTEHFSKEYPEYKRHTKAIIPFLW